MDKTNNQDIDEILSYLPYFEGQHQFGKWEGDKVTGKTEDGHNVISMPHVIYSIEVEKFIHDLYDYDFIVDYRVVNHEHFELIDVADFDTLKQLLSFIVRRDRFCEGLLLSEIENGNVLKILKRLQKIA